MNKELAIKLLRGSVLGTNEQLHEAVFMAIRAIKDEPTTHGRWIKEHLCSTSGGAYSVERCSNCAYVSVVGKTNYCPNCGATMDGGEE